ncbi:MAG: aquaporin family protein [Candidatus Bostrichicola ureolyticus]|nr:MAG: aquaporin family protein [Candidatus Bostrichicola ureolyticus]
MTEFYAELIGTIFLILLGNGVVANVVLSKTKGNNSGWIVITTGWALAVFVSIVITSKYSVVHLNPVITIGLALIKKVEWIKVPILILAQFIGSMIGAFLVWLIYKDHFLITKDPLVKLSVFNTIPAIKNPILNITSEIIATFMLMFFIFNFPYSKYALQISFLIWSIGISLGGTTGSEINPARDLGPRLMHFILPIPGKGSSDWEYAWIPVVGPIIGTIMAYILYCWL